MLQKSLTSEEIARELISTLSVEYHVTPTVLLACMRDRAATNNVALRTLKVVYPNIADVGCFSHTIDHVGEKFETPVLYEFTSAWISRLLKVIKLRHSGVSKLEEPLRASAPRDGGAGGRLSNRYWNSSVISINF